MTVVALPIPQSACVQGNNIISIGSGKGGVGKTWLAATLADAIGKQGKRVLLLDGDLGLANVDVQLGLRPEKDLGDVATGRVSLEDAIIPVKDAAFHLVAGRSGSGVLTTLKNEKLAYLRDEIHRISRKYHWILVDLGAGVDTPVRMLTAGNGTILAITTADPTALTDAYAFIKVTTMKYPGAKIEIIVNMAESQQAGERTYRVLANSCAKFLKIRPKLAGIIRLDPRVNDAIRRQSLMLRRFSDAKASNDVEAIRQRVTHS